MMPSALPLGPLSRDEHLSIVRARAHSHIRTHMIYMHTQIYAVVVARRTLSDDLYGMPLSSPPPQTPSSQTPTAVFFPTRGTYITYISLDMPYILYLYIIIIIIVFVMSRIGQNPLQFHVTRHTYIMIPILYIIIYILYFRYTAARTA